MLVGGAMIHDRIDYCVCNAIEVVLPAERRCSQHGAGMDKNVSRSPWLPTLRPIHYFLPCVGNKTVHLEHDGPMGVVNDLRQLLPVAHLLRAATLPGGARLLNS